MVQGSRGIEEYTMGDLLTTSELMKRADLTKDELDYRRKKFVGVIGSPMACGTKYSPPVVNI